MKKITLALSIALTACSHLPDNEQLITTLTKVNPHESLICQYQKSLDKQKPETASNWYLWRNPNRIETYDDFSNQGEIWEKNSAGQISYTRLFYNEKVALDFTAGDLSAIGASQDWNTLGSLIDTKNFGKELKLLDSHDNNIQQYSGISNGAATEVDWLPALQLPSSVTKKLSSGTVVITLKKCGNTTKSLQYFPSNTDIKNFRHLDFTDLGDMEDDPLVQKIVQVIGHQHSH